MKKIFTIIYCLLLAAFTVYISLDTFVIKTVIRADAEQLNTSMFETASETAETTDANESEPEDADKAETTDADKTEPTDADETETVAAVSGKYYYSDDNITGGLCRAVADAAIWSHSRTVHDFYFPVHRRRSC